MTGPFILLVLAGLGAVGAALVGRRCLRPAAKVRLELWGCLILLGAIAIPQLALRLRDLAARDWHVTPADAGRLALLGGIVAWSLWRLPRLWRAVRAGAAAAAPARSAAPSLRGQLLLVLLPVCGLAVAGLVSLTRDRAAVEADTRREAGQIARELADRLGTAWPGNLSELETGGHEWRRASELGLQEPPPPVSAEHSEITARIMARARRHFRGPPEDVFPVIARFAADGSLVDPSPYPAVPHPPAWTTNLAGLAGGDPEAASPSPDAVRSAAPRRQAASKDRDLALQAEFLALRHTPDGEGDVVIRLLQLGRRAVMDRAESAEGVPLGMAALAEAARRAPEATLDDAWLWLLGDLVLAQPSSLTPWALSLGEAMAKRSGDPGPAARLAELRARWKGAERMRELAAGLAAAIRPDPSVRRNLWLTHRGAAWLAAVQPGHSVLHTSANGRSITLTNQESHVRFLRADTLELSAFHGLHTVSWVDGRERITPPRLPAGLAVSVELEGRRLEVPAAGPVRDDPAPVLAEAEGEFRLEGEWFLGEPGTSRRFDAWPSRPRFTVRVLLADSAALFAAHRRQQWLFGGMILGTAAVAGLGAWQVNRAFGRQLALNEQKSNFVASVSHELRTPLASARLLAEGLASGRVEGEEKRREYAGFLVQETRRLGALVENMLDFARIEQGRKHYRFEPVDLARLVSTTVGLFEPLAAERRVRLQLDLPPGTGGAGPAPELDADGAALQQALVNLLDNALKHAPADSVVTVALEQEPRGRGADGRADDSAGSPPGRVRLSVRDTGPGVPPGDHGRIFERFYRRGSELRRETQGVGLGLAIVKHIAEGHGGRVWVEGGPGQGARFVLELPGGRREEVPATRDPDSVPAP